MTTINIQFLDSTETVIVSYFAGPQDPTIYPNQAQITTGDPRWKTFYDAETFFQSSIPAPTAD